MRRWEGLPRGTSATKDTNYCSTVDCDLLRTPMNVCVSMKCTSVAVHLSSRKQSISHKHCWLCVCVAFQCIRLFHAHARGLEMRQLLLHHSRCKWGTLISGSTRTVFTHSWAVAWERSSASSGGTPPREMVVGESSLGRWYTGVTLTRSCWAITKKMHHLEKETSLAVKSPQMATWFFSTCFLLLHLSLGFAELC